MANYKRIIILEDEDLIRHFYRTLFEKAGFEVRAYKDADKIVEKTIDFKPAIILTDLLMPKINGYEAIKLLKNDQQTKAIPITVISNLGDYVSQQKSAYLGARDFVVKANLTPEQLVNRVRDVLSNKVPIVAVDPKIAAFLKAEERAVSRHADMSPTERSYE